MSGADESSLYVEVTAIEGDEIVCAAKNSAALAGLLTLVHSRGAEAGGSLAHVDLPLLSQHDVDAMKCVIYVPPTSCLGNPQALPVPSYTLSSDVSAGWRCMVPRRKACTWAYNWSSSPL